VTLAFLRIPTARLLKSSHVIIVLASMGPFVHKLQEDDDHLRRGQVHDLRSSMVLTSDENMHSTQPNDAAGT